MQQALTLASLAAARGEVPVGALLVVQNKVVVTSANATEANADSLAHAEILVLQKAQRLLKRRWLEDATLFVTMEPCPMCAGAIVNARIPRVYFGARDPKGGSCGSVCDLFSMPYNHRPAAASGLMEAESAALLRDFFRSLREKKVGNFR